MDHQSILVFLLGSEEASSLLSSHSCYTIAALSRCTKYNIITKYILWFISISAEIPEAIYVFAVLKKVWQLYRIQILQKSMSAAQCGGKEGSDLKLGQHFDYF